MSDCLLMLLIPYLLASVNTSKHKIVYYILILPMFIATLDIEILSVAEKPKIFSNLAD